VGTIAYMSPEQARGEELDSRTDLFSFGAVLYEMVTGRMAFPGGSAAVIHEAILNRAPPPLARVNHDLPLELDSIVNKAIEKDHDLRYQHAAEIRADLQRLRRDTIASSSASYAIPRGAHPVLPLWRNKFALGMAGIALVCMILAAFLYRWHRLSTAGVAGLRLEHTQITFVGDAYMPAVSPDGKSMVYVTGQGSEQKLMMQALPGGPSLELLHGDLFGGPKWSPDGSELAVRVRLQGEAQSGIYVVSRLGRAPRRVTGGAYSCWSPDGSQILGTNQNAEPGIWWVSKLTGARKKIPAPSYQWLNSIDCSEKTGMLLLLTKTADKYQIWAMKPDGSDQRKLFEDQKEIDSPRWSPTEDAIYYFRMSGGTTELLKLPVSDRSTESSLLVSGLETGDNFTLTSDGSQLAYTRTQSYSNLRSVELSALGATGRDREEPLTSGTLSYEDPSISPDGRWVAFTSGSRAKSNIYKMAIDGGQPVQLTFFDAAMSESPGWSPDGHRIAFICNQGGAPRVWMVNADGGSASELDKTNAPDTNNFLAWFPSPDIVYQQPGMHNLRRVNVETQKEEPVLAVDSGGWLVTKPIFSPDGRKIAVYWNRREGPGVWVLTPDKDSGELLYLGEYYPVGWSSDGSFVYAFGGPGRDIYQIELGDSKKSRSVITLTGNLNAGAVSPDRRKIIVSVGEEKSDVWLMQNFDPQAGRASQPHD